MQNLVLINQLHACIAVTVSANKNEEYYELTDDHDDNQPNMCMKPSTDCHEATQLSTSYKHRFVSIFIEASCCIF